jgi:hypothetical protein
MKKRTDFRGGMSGALESDPLFLRLRQIVPQPPTIEEPTETYVVAEAVFNWK